MRSIHIPVTILLLILAGGAFCQPPVVATTSKRGHICLNDVWRFMPAVGDAAQAPDGEWGALRVPASWARNSALPGVEQEPDTQPWTGVNLDELGRGWYEYDVVIPAGWAGRAVVLELTRVSTDAVVYANGTKCGEIRWPRGEVDITDAVTPGQQATIRVLVVSVADEEDVTAYMGVEEGQTWTEPASLDARGIIGEAFLRSRPRGAYISDVFVRPSVRENNITLDIELTGVAQAGNARFTATMLDEAGAAEKTFTATAPVEAADTQHVTVQWPWHDPRLWGLDKPELYTLQLAVEGPGISDEYPQTFGFREFWLDGLHFFLNGTEIRLRPINVRDGWNSAAWVPEAIDNMLDAYRRVGFNIGEHWPNDHWERGSVFLRDIWARVADRKGFLLCGNALNMNRYISRADQTVPWGDTGQKKLWENRMAAQMGTFRNHPSIVMWSTSGNFFGRHQDQNPRTIGRRAWYEYDYRARAGLEGIDTIKKHDPSRPVFTHHGADIGDIHTCNCYLDLIPLQEREEWLSSYVENAETPFLPIEFGTPLHPTFQRGRNGFSNTIVTEPLMTEFCAMYLGSRAYELETEDYRDRLQNTYEAPQRWRNWHGAPELEQAPAFQKVIALFVRNTWRSWRTWGLTAGMVPWSMAQGWRGGQAGYYTEVPMELEPGKRGVQLPTVRDGDLNYLGPEAGWSRYPAGDALVECNGPTLAWIAGSQQRFTEKDHHYYGGETVEKQTVLINDRRREQPFEYEWTATLGGRQVGASRDSGRIAPATNVFRPIAFTVPEPAEKTDGVIHLTARIGEREHEDDFPFRVYPNMSYAAGNAPIHLFDPEGATRKLLQSLQFVTQEWDGRPHPNELVVIGRHALDSDAKPPGDIRDHVGAGGRLLIFAQGPQWFRDAMAFRVGHYVGRRFFPVPTQADHPIVAGLDSTDLRDWRGSSTLVSETWGGLDDSPGRNPKWGWHWGNYGGVSSCPIEKPHNSGWRPILEGEFDLAYSPLMELHYGEGAAVLCTLDLAARTKPDPVAERLARRVVSYAMRMKPEPRAELTVFIGADDERKLLKSIGLQFEDADALANEPALAVIGSDTSLSRQALDEFVEGGGNALLLPSAAGLAGASTETGTYTWTEGLPDWPQCRGLSLSDLRLRGDLDVALLQDNGAVEVGADGVLGRYRTGNGTAILLLLTPDMLPSRERTYFRYSQWRLTRTLTQLLANLGATFRMDAKSLQPGWNLANLPLPLAGRWLYKVERLMPEATDPDNRIQDPGIAPEAEDWGEPDIDTSGWKTCTLPSYWEKWAEPLEGDGAVWFRKQVEIPNDWADETLILQLGNVDDHDITYFNGKKVGGMEDWGASRTYAIPADLVHPGRNLIAVRCFDNYGGGGFGARPEEMRIGKRASKPQPAGEEILLNTDFSDDLEHWDLSVLGPTAEATAALTDDTPGELIGQKSVRIDVTETSPTSWHVSFGQGGFGIEAGVTYTYSFWVKADRPASFTAAIEKDHPPYGSAGLFQRMTATTDWQRVEIDFTPRQSDDKTRFKFQELAGQKATFWFAAPSFSVKPTETDRRPAEVMSFYHPDYMEGHAMGDDPYRYYRW